MIKNKKNQANLDSFSPNWVIPPGSIIRDAIEERNFTLQFVSESLGFSSVQDLEGLLLGKSPITPEIAAKLSELFGSTKIFWLNLEANYCELFIVQRYSTPESYKSIPQLDPNASIASKFRDINVFFGSRLLDEFYDRFIMSNPIQQFCFRKSPSTNFTESKLSLQKNNTQIINSEIWMRQGELSALPKIQYLKTRNIKYNKDAFLNNLQSLRSLLQEQTDENTPALLDKTIQLFENSGVVLVLVPYLKNTLVSGVARIIDDYPVIQISDRGKTNDVIWFTLYHEAAHIYLGHLNAASTNIILDDFSNNNALIQPIEKEADQWARNFLISEKEYNNIAIYPKTHVSLEKCARELRISAGILVGRLQYDGHLKKEYLNAHKIHMKFEHPKNVMNNP